MRCDSQGERDLPRLCSCELYDAEEFSDTRIEIGFDIKHSPEHDEEFDALQFDCIIY